jgi:uncharacterized protein YndB with AHSA1/START domain
MMATRQPEAKVVSSLPDRTITIDRIFDAPRELVFQAWTQPEHFSRWAGCDGTTVPLSTVTMDVRPGGRFAGVMISAADGDRKPFAGVYREVVEPERLVFSWEDPEESVVTITLTDLGDGRTRLHLRQVGFPSGVYEYGLRDTRLGMGEEIDRLAAYVASVARQPA